MKINLMTDYAIKTIKSIAENEKGIVTSNAISEKEDIPHGVLMKVLRQLRMNNIVTSHQGRGEVAGGYSLHTPINKITLLNIIEIMEGPIDLCFCGKQKGQLNDTEPGTFPGNNGIEREYQRISQIIRAEMNRYTIEELLRLGYQE